MKIAIDCGNGVAGAIAPKLFRALGCEVTELFCEVDGTFPNHHPDPAEPKNLQDLIPVSYTHLHPNQSVLLHMQPDNVWRIDFQLGWNADPVEACLLYTSRCV